MTPPLPAQVLDRPRHDAAPHADMPTWLMLLIAAACGLIVANLYYVQPLVVPLGDLVENRRLVPYASHMAPEHVRGRVVGNIVSGLMFGIMLARPVASFVTHVWSWQSVYALSAVLMAALGIVLRVLLPTRRPHSALGAWSFARGGWHAACAVGMGLIGAVLLVFLGEPRGVTSRS